MRLTLPIRKRQKRVQRIHIPAYTCDAPLADTTCKLLNIHRCAAYIFHSLAPCVCVCAGTKKSINRLAGCVNKLMLGAHVCVYRCVYVCCIYRKKRDATMRDEHTRYLYHQFTWCIIFQRKAFVRATHQRGWGAKTAENKNDNSLSSTSQSMLFLRTRCMREPPKKSSDFSVTRRNY